MKARKLFYTLIVAVFVTITMATSVYAADITHTFSIRGEGYDQTNPETITGKICRLVNNTLYVEIDRGTSLRPISATLSYLAPNWLGIYVVKDSHIIIPNTSLGNPYLYDDATVGYQLSDIAFAWAGYSASHKAYVMLTTVGANSSYLFRIYNAEFNFANN